MTAAAGMAALTAVAVLTPVLVTDTFVSTFYHRLQQGASR